MSIFIFNLNAAAVFAVQTPTLSVSVDNAAVNVNGNQVINSVNGTTELPLNLTINTTNKTGYTATLNTETNETALVNSGSASGAKIDSITGASSLLNLPVNSWGFKTSSETNYNPIPPLATPTNIFQTTEKTNGNDVRGLNIGLKLSDNLENGNYTNKLVISAISNPNIPKAIVTEGPDFNTKLKSFEVGRNKIKHFKRSVTAPVTTANVVNIDDEDSDYEIKMWFDASDKTVYYYTVPETVYLNQDSRKMFSKYNEEKLEELQSIDLLSFNTQNVTDMSEMFYGLYSLENLDTSRFNTHKVTNMSHMFDIVSRLTSLDLSNFDTQNVTDMSYMFANMSSLKSLNIATFDTQNVTDMSHMFDSNRVASLDVSSFNTQKVTDMSSMFRSMRLLKLLNLSNFNTQNVTNMSHMFFGLELPTSLDVSNFDTSNVTKMDWMFSGVESLTSLDLSNFNTKKVTDMTEMFNEMKSLVTLDISNFDTSNVKYMSNIFRWSYKLETIYVKSDFNVDNIQNTIYFNGNGRLRGGAGSFLINSSTADKSWLRIDDPAHGRPGYFTRKP